MPEPSAEAEADPPDSHHTGPGFSRFDDDAIRRVTDSIVRFHVVNAITHTVEASGVVMPDASVVVTPRHQGEPIAGETEQWSNLAEYRKAAMPRGWYITFEDPPVAGEDRL